MCGFEHYKGEIIYNGKRLRFEPASLQDTGRLAAMYAETAIHAGNYTEWFESTNPNNFERIGGMFIVHDEGSIRKEITGDNSFFAVIKESGGNIVASLWVSGIDPSFADLDNSFFTSLSIAQRCEIERHINAGRVVFPREIIVSPEYRCEGMADILCYTVFSAAHRAGYLCSLGEVYKASSCRIGGAVTEIGMLNKGGYQTVLGMGGEFVGSFPIRDIKIGSLTVSIESQVFALIYDRVLPVLEHAVDDRRAAVYWGDSI